MGVEEAKQYSFLVKKKRRKLKENPYKIQGVRSRPEQECRTCPFVRSLSVRTLAVLIYSCHNSFSIKLMEFSLTKNFFLINSFLQMHRERYRKTCEIILTVGRIRFSFRKRIKNLLKKILNKNYSLSNLFSIWQLAEKYSKSKYAYCNIIGSFSLVTCHSTFVQLIYIYQFLIFVYVKKKIFPICGCLHIS